MTELAFTVLDAVPQPYGAAPTLLFRTRVTEGHAQPRQQGAGRLRA